MNHKDDAQSLKRNQDFKSDSRTPMEDGESDCKEQTMAQEVEKKNLEFGLLREILFLEMEFAVEARDLLDCGNSIE